MGEGAREPSGALDGPAWTPDRNISPTALRHYGTCPRRVRLQYIDCRPEPFSFDVPLLKGRVAHEVLRQCANLIARHKPVMSDETLARMVSQRFYPRDFPSVETMESHISDVLRWVQFAISCLDRDAEYLIVERMNRRTLTLPPFPEPYMLVARSDVIRLRTDHDGERYIEFIDYKTGAPKDDEVVPVFTRYVSRQVLKQHLPNPTTARMQFTFLWLDARERQVINLSLDYCEWIWESAKGQIGALLSEREWTERPSPLCRYCPYNGNACTAYGRLGSGASPWPVLACDANS